MDKDILSKYYCNLCCHSWFGLWDSACNDKCPSCGFGPTPPIEAVSMATLFGGKVKQDVENSVREIELTKDVNCLTEYEHIRQETQKYILSNKQVNGSLK